MKKIVFLLFCVQLNQSSYPSNWMSFGFGVNNAIYSIYIDTTNGKLYAGGQFSQADSINIRRIAVWDAGHWDSLAHGGAGNHLAIINYQNKIYADGVFFQNSQLFGGIYDGSNWDSIGQGVTGDIYQFKEVNNQLWISGSFYVRGDPDSCKMLATWDGTNWTCLEVPYEGRIEDFEFLNGLLIIGGNFFDSTNLGVDIAYLDSSGYHTMGHRLHGGFSTIHAMALYRGELYIAGYFTQADGNEGDHIMKWNGAQWEDVGGGTDSWILCMKVYEDELYVGGVFEYAGGIHTGNLAKWTGSQWSAVTPSIISFAIYDIQFYNNQLYIGGGFPVIDSLVVNNIAKYTGPLSVSDFAKPGLDFILSSNTAHNNLVISFSASFEKEGILIATDAQGKKQFDIYIPRQTMRKEIDVAELSSGIYFLTLVTGEGTVTKKFIKE